MDLGLNGKTAVGTGGGSGIGKAVGLSPPSCRTRSAHRVAAIPRLRDRRLVGCSAIGPKTGAHTDKTMYAPAFHYPRARSGQCLSRTPPQEWGGGACFWVVAGGSAPDPKSST